MRRGSFRRFRQKLVKIISFHREGVMFKIEEGGKFRAKSDAPLACTEKLLKHLGEEALLDAGLHEDVARGGLGICRGIEILYPAPHVYTAQLQLTRGTAKVSVRGRRGVILVFFPSTVAAESFKFCRHRYDLRRVP